MPVQATLTVVDDEQAQTVLFSVKFQRGADVTPKELALAEELSEFFHGFFGNAAVRAVCIELVKKQMKRDEAG
jgi:hypothetical protein